MTATETPATGTTALHALSATAPTGETVHVVTWRLLDYTGGAMTYGGLQRWLLALVDLLAARGHAVRIHQKATSPFTKELRPGVTVQGHRVPLPAAATPWFNVRVHRHIPRGAPVVYMADDVSFPTCRPRSVLVQHGVWWDGELSALELRAVELMVRRAVRRCAAVVCVDTNFINWYRARWPRAGHDNRLHFVPNFIDDHAWGPQPEVPAAARGGRLTICFPRRSEPRRGVFLLAGLAPALLERHPHVDLRFVVGSGHHTEALRRQLREVPAERCRIEVLPFERMHEAYADSAVVTIPTLCGEGTSLSAIEAMYHGCAVVATWVGGLPNLIQDGHNGLLVPPLADALGAALTRLIEDPDLRGRLGSAAMRTVMPQLGIDRWRMRADGVIGAALGLQPAEAAR